VEYRREVDGLRTIAVLPVILFHAGISQFSGGFVGVDIFFVISGYLITSIILKEMEAGTFSLIRFYERRARRILPALFFVMLVCLPLAWLWMLPRQFVDFSQSLLAIVLFSSNVLFWKEDDYFGAASEEKPLLHTWSLAVEEQYYVLFPILILIVWRFHRKSVPYFLAAIAIASLTLAEWGWRNNPSANFYLTPFRAWELLIGSICAWISFGGKISINSWRDNYLSAIGLALIIYAIFAFDHSTPFPSLYALIPTLGTALIILYATPNTYASRLLSTKPFVGIGLISYSAYLWHQPLFAFARLESLNPPSTITMLILAAASLMLAWLTWRFIEAPFRNRKSIGRTTIFIGSAAGCALFLAIGLSGHVSRGFVATVDPVVAALNNTNSDLLHKYTRPCWSKLDADPSVSAGCLIGNQKSNTSFALLGDSHAGALLKAIDTQATALGLAGKSLTYSSCIPLKDANLKQPNARDNLCRELRKSIFSSLRENSGTLPKTIIIHGRWPLLIEEIRFNNKEGGVEEGDPWTWDINDSNENYSEQIAKHLTRSIESFLYTGRTVILIYPVPEMGWNVPMRLAKIYKRNNSIKPADASVSYETFQERNRRTFKVLDAISPGNGKIIRIYPDRIFCNTQIGGRCAAHLNGEPLYYDDDHISELAAGLVVKKIMESLTDEINSGDHYSDNLGQSASNL